MARRPVRVAYALELRDAIADLSRSARLPEAMAVHGNAQWTPEKLLAACLLMSWHEGQTLTSRFEHVRELLEVITTDGGHRLPTPDTPQPWLAKFICWSLGCSRCCKPVCDASPVLDGESRAGLSLPPMVRALSPRARTPMRRGWGVREKAAPLPRSFRPPCCILGRIPSGISAVDQELTASDAIWKTWPGTCRPEAS